MMYYVGAILTVLDLNQTHDIIEYTTPMFSNLDQKTELLECPLPHTL